MRLRQNTLRWWTTLVVIAGLFGGCQTPISKIDASRVCSVEELHK